VNIALPGSHRGLAPADRRYSDFATGSEIERTAGTLGASPTDPIFLVVGFDGTEPAQRALESATRLLHNRDGALEVVYVAHIPAGAARSPAAKAEVRKRSNDLAAHLASDVRSQLGTRETRWHFQRRDGTVARELSAVADELRRRHGPHVRVAVIVGGSAHKDHRVLGSVSVNLERLDRPPVIVVQ
jgi:nucleotide-binding universal stress UspA family protein